MTIRDKTGPTPRQTRANWDYIHRDKRQNKPSFNRMANKRRKKAKHDAQNRKKNQRIQRMSRR